MSRRTIVGLNVALLLVHLGLAVAVWDTLPSRIPIHFTASGRVDGWASLTWFSWLGPWLISASSILLLYGVGRAAARMPELWNIPEKKRFLALPPTERAAIEDRLQAFTAAVGLGLVVCFGAVQLAVYLAALSGGSAGWPIQVVIFAPIVVILVLALSSSRTIAREIRRRTEALQEKEFEGA